MLLGGGTEGRWSVWEKWSQEGWETQEVERTKPGMWQKVLECGRRFFPDHMPPSRGTPTPTLCLVQAPPPPRAAHRLEGLGEASDSSCAPFPSLFRFACRERGCQGPQPSRGVGSAPGSAALRSPSSAAAKPMDGGSISKTPALGPSKAPKQL